MTREVCSSYVQGDFVCRDGFIQKPFCFGGGRCSSCGALSERLIPACLTGEIAEIHANLDGSPRYYRTDGE